MNALAGLIETYRALQARHGRLILTRDDLTPGDAKRWLNRLFMADWKPPECIVVRLSGTRIDAILGRNVTGRNFFELYRPEHRPIYSAFYGHIVAHPCGGYSLRRVQAVTGDYYAYHSIYLPLRNDTAWQMAGAVEAVLEEDEDDLGGPQPASAVASPDFKHLLGLSLFDIGAGVPAGDFPAVDIGSLLAELDAQIAQVRRRP